MQAQRLDRGIRRDVAADVDVIIGCKQLPGLFQRVQLAIGRNNIVFRELCQLVHNLPGAGLAHGFIHQPSQLIRQVVEHMHRAAVDIQQKINPFF